MVKCLHGTVGLIMMLEVDNSHIIKWWFSGVFTVHPGMKCHMGAMILLVKGFSYDASLK